MYGISITQHCHVDAVIKMAALFIYLQLLYLHLYTSLCFDKLLLINENEWMNEWLFVADPLFTLVATCEQQPTYMYGHTYQNLIMYNQKYTPIIHLHSKHSWRAMWRNYDVTELFLVSISVEYRHIGQMVERSLYCLDLVNEHAASQLSLNLPLVAQLFPSRIQSRFLA